MALSSSGVGRILTPASRALPMSLALFGQGGGTKAYLDAIRPEPSSSHFEPHSRRKFERRYGDKLRYARTLDISLIASHYPIDGLRVVASQVGREDDLVVWPAVSNRQFAKGRNLPW